MLRLNLIWPHPERRVLEEANALGIGPRGMGGTTTLLVPYCWAYPSARLLLCHCGLSLLAAAGAACAYRLTVRSTGST